MHFIVRLHFRVALNYLIMRKYYAKTAHPELLNDLSFVISDIRDSYFVNKIFKTIFSVTATKLKYILLCSVNVRSHKYHKFGSRI